MIAGYLTRTVLEHIDCTSCLDILSNIANKTQLMSLISHLDRDGLRYPRPRFVAFLEKLEEKLHHVLPSMTREGSICRKLTDAILPHMMKNPIFHCEIASDSKHTETLCSLILIKFLRPYIKNYANSESDRHEQLKLYKKPVTRKILKLS